MEDDNKSNIPWWQPGTQLFAKLSGWIGGPALAGVLLGKYLDKKYNSEPWLLIGATTVSFVISMIMLVKVGKEEMEKAEKRKK